MPSSLTRKIARQGKFKTFIYNGKQRIVDGVRYDIIPAPAAQCAYADTTLSQFFRRDDPIPHTIRRRAV